MAIQVTKRNGKKESLDLNKAFIHRNLTIEKQRRLIKALEDINHKNVDSEPVLFTILEEDFPLYIKEIFLRKLRQFRSMDPSMGEYFKLKSWLDAFRRIPFNKNQNLPISADSGLDKCYSYIEESKAVLDKAVYGLNDAKLQIMQLVGQWLVNPDAVGTALAIKGPMGTGKTTLIMEGLSKILNRPAALIALGGATDSSFLEGHSYTYEGSTWGQLVDILMRTKCSNPIIFFDELDKVSEGPKGDEIIGILTHLIDTSQNKHFHDKYFSELEFDVSKCLFVFSYNDESKINKILLDRMYKITTKGYGVKEKVIIVNNYLLPKIREQLKFAENELVISDDNIKYIINNFTENEAGVRNLKRCLEIIFSKLNLCKLMNKGENIFKDDLKIENISFPFTLSEKYIDELIKKEDTNTNWKIMYT